MMYDGMMYDGVMYDGMMYNGVNGKCRLSEKELRK